MRDRLRTRRQLLGLAALLGAGAVAGLGLRACQRRAAARARAHRPLSKGGLGAASRYSRARVELALLVYQSGRTLLESYRNGATPESGNRLASCTKGLWGLCAAAAVQDGLLRFDEPVTDTIVEWRGDPRRAGVTVAHLLSMTSGVDPGYGVIDNDDVVDKVRAALRRPMVAEPGTRFSYGPANTAIFGALLGRKLAARRLTPLLYLRRRIMRPLHARWTEWRTDPVGQPFFAAGAYMTARDALRVGRLLLGRGAADRRRVVDAAQLETLLQGTAANPCYGLTFWLNHLAARPDSDEVDVEKILGTFEPFGGWRQSCLAKAAPPDLFAMLGSGGQRLYVAPSIDLVVVRQGNGDGFVDSEFLGALLA